MGVLYNQFIEKIIKSFEESPSNLFEEFINSPKGQKIMAEFDQYEGSLYWAINLQYCFEKLQQNPSPELFQKIQKPIKDNLQDWLNDPLLIPKKNKKD